MKVLLTQGACLMCRVLWLDCCEQNREKRESVKRICDVGVKIREVLKDCVYSRELWRDMVKVKSAYQAKCVSAILARIRRKEPIGVPELLLKMRGVLLKNDPAHVGKIQ